VKSIVAVGALLCALAMAAPALAEKGQSASHSGLTVQVGSATASPSAAAESPANLNAPVCVASTCQSSSESQTVDGSSASGTGTADEDSTQSASESLGTVQVGSVGVSPVVAADAPVDANAPVCVLASCSSGSGGQQTGGASGSSAGSGSGQAGDQSASESLGTVQVGSVGVSPVVAADAPVDANAPVCVLASCSSVSAGQQTGGDGPGGSGPGGGGTEAGGGTGGGPGGGRTIELHHGPVSPAPAESPTSVTPHRRGTLGDRESRSETRSQGARFGLGSSTLTGSRPWATGKLAAHEVLPPVRLSTGVLPFAGLSLTFWLALGLALIAGGGACRRCSTSRRTSELSS
jgi:hypothetical protein